MLELGDSHQQARAENLPDFCNLYVAEEHQGYSLPHH